MAQVINTNTMSLNAQRNLSTSGSSLATTIQRLSSGSRINSAKDDAAGLAISERFGTQIRGTDVAIRNANDGISLAQVAEGSLSEIGNNLQRVRELAVQASNATNSASDRKALQAEVTQLVSEIDRVAKQSEFNGTKLLDGSFSSQLFQVGANAGQAIAIDKVVDATVDKLGNSSFSSATLAQFDGANAPPTVRTQVGGTISIKGADGTVSTVDVGKVDVAAGSSAADFNRAAVTAVNAKLGETGVLATLSEDGLGISITQVKSGGDLSTGVDADVAGTIALTTKAWDDATGDWATGAGAAAFATSAVTSASETVTDLDVSTVTGAQKALSLVDNALESINNTRADLGAIQNRFTSVVANLQTSTENLSASRSRIKDTDFAKETAELTRTQILQQAGTAMLAQANQVPQNVLSLLR
ncbi:flagellin [Stenotrophomonas sp. TWI1149]|uniref:flagellin n=1 Tax=unclassified Stenotrophomonas TaxID=196198 RepID=UPI00320942EF